MFNRHQLIHVVTQHSAPMFGWVFMAEDVKSRADFSMKMPSNSKSDAIERIRTDEENGAAEPPKIDDRKYIRLLMTSERNTLILCAPHLTIWFRMSAIDYPRYTNNGIDKWPLPRFVPLQLTRYMKNRRPFEVFARISNTIRAIGFCCCCLLSDTKANWFADTKSCTQKSNYRRTDTKHVVDELVFGGQHTGGWLKRSINHRHHKLCEEPNRVPLRKRMKKN